ncbi:MAG: acyl-CoA dehydrogenase family protein [Chloroflexi bacterium]|nr:acyl-CoA dehydrogenase family protein [Chloroflexota bacterium]
MDFGFTAKQQAWRQQVRDFLGEELPSDWRGMGRSFEASDEGFAYSRQFARKLAQKGWLAVSWPKEYGGRAASHTEQTIFNEEMVYNRAPNVVGIQYIAVAFVGPALMIYGTEEQKKRHLPAILAGEEVWCQGFSEPNAGSDLASLQTRAVEEGDDYVINGEKLWTTGAHHADWCILGTRTDPTAPKHKGISYFLLDMKTPGVTVEPLLDLTGSHHVNHTILQDVKIPRTQMLGEKNRGWYEMATTLDFERSSILYSAGARRSLKELVDYVKETKSGRKRSDGATTIRHRLAELAIEAEAARVMAYRVAWMQDAGKIPNYEASISKLFSTELSQRIFNVGMQLLGPYAELIPDSRWAALGGEIPNSYMSSIPATLAGGSSEIQRNIIATRGLGLPR